MSQKVTGPDGQTFEFPDNTPPGNIEGILREHYATQQAAVPAVHPSAPVSAAPKPDNSLGQWAGTINHALAPYAAAAGLGAAAGAPFAGVGAAPGAAAGVAALGLTDIASPAVNAVASALGSKYRMPSGSEAIQRLTDRLGLSRAPKTANQQITSDILQGAAGGGGTALAAKNLAGHLVSPVARGVASTLGTQPGMQMVTGAFGSAAPSTAANAFGVTDPKALMALGFGGAMLGGKIRGPAHSSVPSSEILEKAGQYYTTMQQAGVHVAPTALGQRVADLSTHLVEKGYIPSIEPKVAEWMGKLQTFAKNPMSFRDLDTVRSTIMQDARVAEKAGHGTTAMLLKNMGGNIDDFLMNVQPGQTTAGNTAGVAPTLAKAREAWAQGKKASVLETALADATDLHEQSANSTTSRVVSREEALRRQFKKIVNNKFDFGRFNPEEQAAIKEIANGTVTSRAMGSLSYLAPSSFLRIGSELGLSIGGAAALGGSPLMGTIIGGGAMAAGQLGKVASNRMTEAAWERAQHLVAGNPLPNTLPVRAGLSSIAALRAANQKPLPPADVNAWTNPTLMSRYGKGQ